MAFTGAEFLRGGWWAILTFTLTLPAVMIWGPSIVMGEPVQVGGGAIFAGVVVPLLGGTIAGFVYVTYGSALAYLLGLALRRTRRLAVHRVCFAMLGLLVGYVTLVLTDLAGLTMLSGALSGSTGNWMTVCISGTVGIAVWAGWEITSAKALRADAPGS